MEHLKLSSGILIMALVFSTTVRGQSPHLANPEGAKLAYHRSNPAYQYFLAPGTDNQLLMKINVWGEVLRPGVIEVPDRTDLLSALSLAGGPVDGAKLSKIKIIRGFNGSGNSWDVNLKKVVQEGQLEKVPVLQPGDTVVVPKSGFRVFSKGLAVLYNVAVIVTASALLLN